MGENSKIEWTDHTWNPWMGCHKISEGCRNCYMFRERRRYGKDPEVVVRSKTRFYDPLKWEKKAALTGERKFVFACSWSDWFIEEADPIRDEAWEIVKATPHLTYQILTKRPENIPARLPKDWDEGYPNVILMVTAEDQAMANLRIPQLLKIPARLRGVSIEPMLGFVNLKQIMGDHVWFDVLGKSRFDYGSDGYGVAAPMIPGIDWVIVGGETGVQARPLDIRWVETIRNQCIIGNIPFFFKSWGEWWPKEHVDYLGKTSSLPDISICKGINQEGFYRIGRNNSGRLLDGEEWSQFPT